MGLHGQNLHQVALQRVLVEALGVDSMRHHSFLRGLRYGTILLLDEQLFIALLLSKVQEMTLFAALDDVFAEGAMLKDALLEEVELARLEAPRMLRVHALEQILDYGCVHH